MSQCSSVAEVGTAAAGGAPRSWARVGPLLSGLLLAAACAEPHRPPADAGSAVLDASRSDDASDGPADAAPPRTFVVVTLNTHSFQEGSDSLDKLRAIGEGLAALQADVVGLNEVMSGAFWSYEYGGVEYDGAQIIREALEAVSGVPWEMARYGFAHWETGELMSNVVLSRWPIEQADSRPLTTTDFWPAPAEQRNVVFVRTRADGWGSVNVFVTHAWGWDSVDTQAQIAEVHAFLADASRGDETLEVVLGDLNMPSTRPAYADWVAASGAPLVDTWARANPDRLSEPTTFDGQDRIDYVLARWSDAGFFVLSSVLAFDGRELGGVQLPIVSDHAAVVTTFGRP